jgi:hypothetical protein
MELITESDPVNSFLFSATSIGTDLNDPLCVYFFYKISCKNPSVTKCYIGKTTNIKTRIANHKTKSKISDYPLYVFIRNNGGFDNFKFEILHKCLCNEKLSIYIERSLIMSNDDVINYQIPYAGEKGHYNKNKCKEHYKIQRTCECGWVGSKMNQSKHVKTSAKHRQYCIEKFEKELETLVYHIGENGPHENHIC